MTFARTRDARLIRGVLTHPTQARMSSEDATNVEAWQPSDDERVIYLAATMETACKAFTELAGIFTLLPQNSVCFEIHAAILPAAWGCRSREALRGAIAWTFAETGARRIVASIPAYNKLAVKLALDCGMRAFGRNRESFLRGGRLHDQILVGISK